MPACLIVRRTLLCKVARLLGIAAAFLAASALAGETTTYSYDALGRLTNAAHSGTANSGLNQAYSYVLPTTAAM